MSDEQRTTLREKLRGGQAGREVPFAQAGLADQCVRGGVGQGGRGQVVRDGQPGGRDGRARACPWASWTPTSTGSRCRGCWGVTTAPTRVDDMILPPFAHGVKVISIGMFVPGNQPVVWRGPMLHRALQQFLTDVFWGDLDVLLLDLPPGHRRHRDLGGAAAAGRRDPRGDDAADGGGRGRRARRLDRAADPAARRRRGREHVVARAPRRLPAWSSSAPAAGRRSPTRCPARSGPRCRCWVSCRSTSRLREGGDAGTPVVLSDPDSPAAVALRGVARQLGRRARGLAGRSLGLTPVSR